jgi:FkbM family methyltransferase
MNPLTSLLRNLPEFKGKQRLMKYLYSGYVKKAKDIELVGKLGATYILPNLKENVAFEIFINGIYEPDTHEFLVNNIPQNGTILDLGANIGSVAIPLCLKRHDIKCICVEASPWIYDYLLKNIAVNKLEKQVTCINKALFDKDNEQLTFYSPVEKFGKGSLSPLFTEEGVMVSSIKVDTLVHQLGISKVDMLKIDIEGYEYYAFKGGETLLSGSNAPSILFEFVDWAEEAAHGVSKGDAQAILLKFGYRLYRMKGTKMSPLVEGQVIKDGTDMLFGTKKVK